MRKTWKRFNKLMKKGKINKVIKVAGLKNEKTNDTDSSASRGRAGAYP
tara:strand:- start:352 stop:495 length:144 start_codon:yes stop_codon:yes gene_type:complete